MGACGRSTNARAGQFYARMTWSQSSMCSLSISRTVGISALRFFWGYPVVSTRAECLSATAPRRSAPSDRLVAGDAGGGHAKG